ncbi:MAG: hypothetical protein AAF799_45995 [Myxococcota bacterium]
MSPRALVALAFLLGGGCSDKRAKPTPAEQSRANVEASDPALDTDLPAQRPPRIEVDLRRRNDNGDDAVLKLTEAGARYGLAQAKTRVALRYRLEPEALENLYLALRTNGFDRIETGPSDTSAGSSMRVQAGPGRYSVSAMGRFAPLPDYTQAYANSVEAAEKLLPSGRSTVTFEIHWDPSMQGKTASLDLDLGEDFVGLERGPGTMPEVTLHVAQERSLQILMRHGTPPASLTLTLDAGKDRGVEVAFDAEVDSAVLRPLAGT